MTKKQIPIDEPPEAPATDEPTPLAFTVEPSSGPQHTPVMISGSDFGAAPGTITLNEVPAPVVLWTPLAIQTIVPYGATSGDLEVITADGRRAAVPFEVTLPDA